MEKRKQFYILLIFIITFIIAVIFVFYHCNCRIVSKNIGNIANYVYVPSGMADEYKSLLNFSIDEHTIWTYKLNVNEKEVMEQNIDNGIWKKMTEYDTSEVDCFFTVNLDSYWPENISNDLYYCLYDFSLNEFINTNDDVAILGWHRVLFVYDIENAMYYCISKSI